MNASILDRFSLVGKRVLVTGASSGIGGHFAYVMASAGASVVLAARRVDRLESLVQTLRTSGKMAQAVELDVTNPDSIGACFDALSRTGVPDVVVNNAGVTVTKSALEQSPEDYDQVLNTNLKGGWLVATEAARRMVSAGKGGSIINIASILGERVAGGVAPYAISKAGLIQMSKALALELARYRIRVNALLPGYVVTDLNREFLHTEQGQKLRDRIPSRRFQQLSDLDGPLLLLASDAGSAISGASLAVDGAHLVSSL